MKIYESGENYLETILMLEKRRGVVRSIDVATELGFSKPSVSRALRQLVDKGLISIEKSGAIIFSPEGFAYAQQVFRRHRILTYFLRYVLEVPASQAEQDACRMEHVISDVTLERIVAFLEARNILPKELAQPSEVAPMNVNMSLPQ